MSYILTTAYPIANGDTAAHYAANLALTLNLPLRIVYPYTVPVSVGEIPMPVMPVEEVRDAANAHVADLVNDLKAAHPTLHVSADVVYGGLPDVLDDVDTAPVLVVIGNDDSEDSDAWLGSESADILRDGRWPVLAVPHHVTFKVPQQVCLAADAATIREGLPLGSLLSLKQQLGFRLTVLHVMHNEQPVVYEGSALDAQLAGMAGYSEVSVDGAVDAAIAAFADTHGMDWLALAPHYYGFWAGLFHRSHTSRVLHLAHVPVLALH
jgi:nucleotide-binding universal stress UspA family protein